MCGSTYREIIDEKVLVILQVWTPNIVTLWEALLTVLQFGLLLIHAYAQDKRWPYLSLPMYVIVCIFVFVWGVHVACFCLLMKMF